MLTASELLMVWERGMNRPLFERALLLLEASSEQSWENLAALSIGQRDAQLLGLREAIFGRSLPCLTVCPDCGERLELNFNIDDLLVPPPPRVEQENNNTLAIEVEGLTLEYRLPNSYDLSAASGAKDSDSARALLIERCLLSVHEQGKDVNYSSLSSSVLDALTEAMAEADPQSHLELALSCPSCKLDWQTVFDIASYLWGEIETWALRIISEVHILASAYGWRETEILALSPLRRQLYLERVGT